MMRRAPINLELDEEIAIDVGDAKETAPADSERYCHIEYDNGKTYCGYRPTEPTTCPWYGGEAICPSCGLPTCPTCAVQSSLNERLA
jgi:hypothetical protein